MKPIQSLFILAFVLLSFNSVSAQYGNGYNNGYGNGYGRGGGMGMDRSMMQGPQSSPSKPKEVPVEETAAKIVEQMKPEVNLDELQVIAITNVLADSMREQGVLLKNESSSQDQKIEQINALREVTTKKITAFLNPEQVEKYTVFMANFKEIKKTKSKKKKDKKEVKEDSEETKPTE
jgi:dsDNA-binding SOS-regulon protein